jgi:hypothetical protein
MTDAEKRAQRGLYEGKRQPSRKVSCDMKYLCTYIEGKASEAGLDTSDRRLDKSDACLKLQEMMSVH